MSMIIDSEFKSTAQFPLLPLDSITPEEIRACYGLPLHTKHGYSSYPKRGVKGYVPSYGNCISILFRRRTRQEANPFAGQRHIYNNALQNLPMDLIIEIFSYLHPWELYDLLRSCRAFRQLLISRQSQYIWRAAYRAHSDVPDCPKDMSYPAWTTLLFGPDICHKCDAKRSRIDFVFRWKICQECWDKLMVPLPDVYPFNSKDCFSKDQIRSVCKPDYTTGLRYIDYPKWYLKEDIERVEKEITNASNQDSLEAYRDEQKQHIKRLQKRLSYASLCDTWSTLVMREFESVLEPIIARIQEKLRRYISGHDHDSIRHWHSINYGAIHQLAIDQVHGDKLDIRSIDRSNFYELKRPTSLEGEIVFMPPMEYFGTESQDGAPITSSHHST